MLYKDNIETISFNYFDKVSARFLKFFKLKSYEFNKLSFDINFKLFFLFFLFTIKNNKFILKYKFISLKIFFELYLQLDKYDKFFKKKNYNFLFFDNDTLIPDGFLLSANINRVKTISMQDRLISHMYFNRCFFNLYLIAGKKFEKIFKNKYLIDTYDVLGLTRTELIKKKIINLDYLQNKKSDIVACLPVSINSDWVVNVYGECGTSIDITLNFCKSILKLSKIYKQKKFIIKFKYLDSVNDKTIIEKINKIISSSDNLFLNYENNLSSANLIAHSEFVIGIHSSILDEAIAAGKNVLIYDNNEFISSFSFYLKNRFLIVKNFDELLFKFKNLINKNESFYKNYIECKKNYINNYLTEDGKISYQKKIVEKIEKYIIKENYKK